MNNFNLKYFAIVIIALSVLIVAGALLFRLLSKQNEATQSAQPAQSEPKAGPGEGGEGAGASDQEK